MGEKTLTVSVEVPADMDWSDLAELEDKMSKAVGEVMKEHGLERDAHERKIKSDYRSRR